jgi:hypothetical protein
MINRNQEAHLDSRVAFNAFLKRGGYRPASAPLGYGERIKPLQATFAQRTRQQRKRLTSCGFIAKESSSRDFRDAKAIAQTLRELWR